MQDMEVETERRPGEHQTNPFRSAKPFLRKLIELEELHSQRP